MPTIPAKYAAMVAAGSAALLIMIASASCNCREGDVK